MPELSRKQTSRYFDSLTENEVRQTSNNRALKITSHQQQMQTWLAHLLAKADVILNGHRPWDPQVDNPALYDRLIKTGSLAIGEAYMAGWWHCNQVEELIRRVLAAKLDKNLSGKWIPIKSWLLATLFNRQSEKRAYQVGEHHYDAGNDLYEAMLDPTMAYSCGYWKDANDLHQAQLAKLRLICAKAKLNKGDHVLEIGCGWGSFAQLAAREFDVKVTGITISKEQQTFAQTRCEGLAVDIHLQDYRQLTGQFDKLVSIGMFEHVGPKNYDTYFQHAQRLMKDDGVFVLHTIGSDVSQGGSDPWIDKYIFPNGVIPSLTQISNSVEPYFVIEDVHNFGLDYAKTLLAWHDNFVAAWPRLKDNYDERFFRMWSYYLKVCAGAFLSRSLQLYQVVLRKRFIKLPDYQSIR